MTLLNVILNWLIIRLLLFTTPDFSIIESLALEDGPLQDNHRNEEKVHGPARIENKLNERADCHIAGRTVGRIIDANDKVGDEKARDLVEDVPIVAHSRDEGS